MSSDELIFGLVHYSHLSYLNNRHKFTITSVCAIRPNINLSLDQLTSGGITQIRTSNTPIKLMYTRDITLVTSRFN